LREYQKMRAARSLWFFGIGVGVFLVQLVLVARQPNLGLSGPFPFAILSSIRPPLLAGTVAVLALLFTKPAVGRLALFGVLAVSVIEIGVIKAMLWLNEPMLILVILVLNALLAVEFLNYGYDYIRAI
jgi:hypothetical protein